MQQDALSSITRYLVRASVAEAQLAFVLREGLPMCRDQRYRYIGVARPEWHATPLEAVRAAMLDQADGVFDRKC